MINELIKKVIVHEATGDRAHRKQKRKMNQLPCHLAKLQPIVDKIYMPVDRWLVEENKVLCYDVVLISFSIVGLAYYILQRDYLIEMAHEYK